MPKFEETGGKNKNRVVSLDRARAGKSNDAMKAAAQQEGREAVVRQTRNASPERISNAQCHVCQHPFRDWIETMLVRGMAFKTLGDRVSPKVDRRSVSNHYKNHMDLQDAALIAILEKEAELEGRNQEEGVHDQITKRSVLEVAMRKGFDDVLNGVTTVEPRDLIQMVKILGEMDSHQSQVGLDEMRAQVQIFIQAIKDVCDQDTQNAIAARVKALRTRENIDTQMERVMAEPVPEIPEATLVE